MTTQRLAPLVARLLVLINLPVSILAGQVELESDFTGIIPAANLPWTATSVQSTSIAFNEWTMGTGLRPMPINNAIGFDVDATGTDSTMSDALLAKAYLSSQLSPVSEPLDLRSMQMNLQLKRETWWAPRRFAVFTSVGGFNEGDEVFISEPIENEDNNSHQLSFFLPEEGYGQIDGPFEIRVLAYDARYGGHEALLERFSLESALETHQLSINTTAGGSATGVPDKSVYEDRETARLLAVPDEGFRFAGWSGAIEGKGNPRHLTMDSDKTVTALFEPLPEKRMEVGTNLNGLSDWSTSMVFKDAFKRMRTWRTSNKDVSGPWDSGFQASIPMDAEEWPLQVPFDPGGGSPTQIVHTILVTANEAGPYTLLYEGSGSFLIRVDGQSKQYPPADGTARTYPLTLDRHSRITLELYESGPAPNHLRNFKLVPDTLLDNYETDPFHPIFLKRSNGFSIFRFMNWASTNNSETEDWSNRTRIEHYTQTRPEGIAPEWIIRFCNHHNTDAWICIPHRANDTYVTQTAQLFRNTLNTNLRVYVEYSNETWNGIFSQNDYVYEQGEALGLDPDSRVASDKFTAMRSSQIWKTFEDVFGAQADARVINVLATQGSSLSVSTARIDGLNDPAINTNLVFADVLAIAPYFGHNYSTSELPPHVPAYPTAEEVAGGISQTAIEALRTQIAAQKALANEQGMQLVCYEGGQHFTGLNEARDDETLEAILTAANRHPQMYRRYIGYLDMLQEEGVELYVNFSLSGQWGKSGSWGTLESIDQPVEDAVKYTAISDWTSENLLNGNLLQITQIASNQQNVLLEWRSKPTHSYEVETSTNFTDWAPEPDPIPSMGLSTTNTLQGAEEGHLFFRIMDGG